MSVNIDVKDRKILYELSKNCRMPSTRLARAVGVSREVVDYRIKNLVGNGVITCFVLDVDIARLGCAIYLVYLELQKVDGTQEEELLKYIVSNPLVSWTTTQTGKWNVIFDVIAKDIKQVDGIVRDLQAKYSAKIGDYRIAAQLEYRHYFSKYFGEEPEIRIKEEIYEPDATDLKLLKILSNNARTNYVSLSKELGLNANTIKLRLKKLLSAGIIRRFTIQVNKSALGFEAYNLQLTFKDTTPEKARQFLKYIKWHRNVNFYYLPLGHWDLEIGLFVKDASELRKTILEFRNKYSEVIRIYDCMIFYEELKPNYVPEGAFTGDS